MREGRVWAEVRVVAKTGPILQISRVMGSIVFIDEGCAAGPRFGTRNWFTIEEESRPGPPKEPYRYARFGVFFAREMWPTDSLCKKGTILFGKQRPQFRHLPIRQTYMWKLSLARILHYQ